MNAHILSRLCLLYSIVLAAWINRPVAALVWIAPTFWAVGIWVLCRRSFTAPAAVSASLLIYMVECGKLWPQQGDNTFVGVLMAAPPRQLALLTFFYLPVLSFFVMLDRRNLAADLMSIGLWRLRLARHLCVGLLFITALRDAIHERYKSIMLSIEIRGLRRRSLLSNLIVISLWAPALIRLSIVEAIERSEIHSSLTLKPGIWQPPNQHSAIIAFDIICLIAALALFLGMLIIRLAT